MKAEPQSDGFATDAQSAAALNLRLANLSPEKLAALQKRLLQQERSGYGPIRTLPDEESYPLSFHQLRLWFIEQFRQGTPLYNVTRAVRMRGPLNRGALMSALQSLVDRHEALRSTFHVHDGEPVQRINAPPKLQLQVVDLRAADEERERTEPLRQRLTSESRRVFDLSADLMIRTVLYQIADEEHVLQVTIHHLACDGWSLQLLFDELAVLYRGFRSGGTVELPQTRVRYVDFARWQREPRQTERFAERIQWWKRQLAGAPPVLELATDRPRPRIESGSGAFLPFEIPSDLLERLEVYGREENATLYMTLLAGFFILLHRYTGMEDFSIGSATAGRHRPETHGIVGFFVDTVVLRADLSGEPTTRQVLRRVRQTVIDAIEHGDVPFDRIVASLDLPKDLSRHPLFQILFNAPPQYTFTLDALDVSPVDVAPETSRFDMEMTYGGGANRTSGLTWNKDLFDAGSVQRLLKHYQILLEGMVASPDQRISDVPLLDNAERQQILIEWNRTETEFQPGECIHTLFERQVKQTPDAVAITFQGTHLTFGELNRRSNQVAHRLQALGVKPETFVGVATERSPAMVVGLLGVLKAGGAYIPLDPTYPEKRLALMLEDSKAAVVITDSRAALRLPAHHATVLCLDTDWEAISKESEKDLVTTTTPDSAAYALYTSGSTGIPKGVVGLHKGAINRLNWMWKAYPFDDSDICCQKTTLNFVDSVWEIFGPLLQGISSVVVPDQVAKDPIRLVDLLAKHRVTRIVLVPALLRVLLDTHNELGDRLPQLKIWISSGETLTLELFQRFQDSLPHRRLINLYGSSEVAADVTCFDALENAPSRDVPIGRPIANTKAYVLDRHLQPVPIGIPGELHISGEGLAREYLHRPELTAERFLADPFSNSPGSRIFKTGDVVRWLPNGMLEFRHRVDHQVKLRGFRIEPGEIESVLKQHNGVNDAVVILREDSPRDKRLVAYVVANSKHPDGSALRSFLHQRLPEYMIPSAFVLLHSLPVTPNGKIDRRALPMPESRQPDSKRGFVAPRTPVEKELASLWSDVLNVKNVGIHDNFFELGGHSLSAVRLFVQIAKAHEVDLPLATLFQAPTIERLAEKLGEVGWQPSWSSLVAMQPNGRKPPFFLIHPIGGNILFYRDLVRHLDANQPVYGLQPRGLHGQEPCLRRVEDIAAHYVNAIQSLQPIGPYFFGGASFGGVLAYEMARQLHHQGQTVALLALFDTFGPGYLKRRSGSSTKRIDVYSLANRIRLHRANFLEYNSQEKVHHLVRMFRTAIQRMQSRLTSAQRNELPEKIRSVHLANIQALRSYVHSPIHVRITLFRATTQPWSVHSDPVLGWGDLALGGVDVHNVSGYHAECCKDPHAKTLADKLTKCLAIAQQGSDS